MRRILIEQLPQAPCPARRPGARLGNLDQLDLADEQAANDFLDLDEACPAASPRKTAPSPTSSQLRYFAGH